MADGYVYVDAGCIWIGDPCYVMGDDASNRVKDWIGDFCNKLDNNVSVQQPLGMGTGMCIDSGHGDGRYPVTVEYDPNSGRPASVTVTFIEEHSEDDDYE